MSFGKVELYVHGGNFCPSVYVFTRVEEFPPSPRKRVGKALWMESEEELYVTCAGCGAINSLEEFEVAEDRLDRPGRLEKDIARPCVHCCHCGAAFWVHFENWEKVSEKTRLAKVPLRWRAY